MNWLWVGALSAAIYLSIFGYCLAKRRFTVAGVGVGLANLALAGLHSVAPIRGWADPDYAGYSVGFLRAEQGPMVTLVTGTIFIAAVMSACFAVLGDRGWKMTVVAMLDGLFAINLTTLLVVALIAEPHSFRINLGEYLSIPPVPAFLILFVIFVVPLSLSTWWAANRIDRQPPKGQFL